MKSLLKSQESEWLEFKENNYDPERIGKNISAISNSVALLERDKGYILWGLDNVTGKLVGTDFQPRNYKVGNEELENWLLRLLKPKVDFRIYEESLDEKKIVLFEINSSTHQPISFKNIEYIRIGSYTKKLQDHPEKEKTLWKIFDTKSFEERLAIESITSDKVLQLIDFSNYFKRINELIPESHTAILERLINEQIITSKNGTGIYNITNLGAILFCNNLKECGFIKKAPRIIVYKKNNRVETIREKEFNKGYAIDFEGIVDYVDSQIPKNEEIKKSLRKEVSMYPSLAIRELVANALIHQNFDVKGSGPMIEIFSDRIEISNPGKPLIDTLRFIDEPPKSRNEAIVNFMRRLKFCEDRGSGIDKVIYQIELYQLPAPDFRATDFSTVVTLFSTKNFSQMTTEERVRACYQHACLQWVSGQSLTNSSLRKRFGVSNKNYPMVSKIIKESLNKKLLRIKSNRGPNRSYTPFWTI